MPSTPNPGLWREGDTIVCRCRQEEDFVDENRWFFNPDPLGCPKHRPVKQYCRYHHSGFYGNCSLCASYDAKQLQKEIVRLLGIIADATVPYHTGSQTVDIADPVVEPDTP